MAIDMSSGNGGIDVISPAELGIDLESGDIYDIDNGGDIFEDGDLAGIPVDQVTENDRAMAAEIARRKEELGVRPINLDSTFRP